MRKTIKFILIVLQILLFLAVGIVTTGLTTRIPVQGLQIEVLRGGGCGIPSAGLPLPYVADMGITLCPAKFDYGALMIDVLFWSTVLFFMFSLAKKGFRHRLNAI